MADLEKIFNPESIAIVGASESPGKVGNVIAKNILELGYAGKVFLVNPNHENILGQKGYKSLKDIQEKVDLAIMAIPSDLVLEIIRENAEKIKNYIIISAGFSEIGKAGKKKEEDLKKLAEENDLNILGPNCLGIINPEIKMNASFAGGMPKVGGVSLISQSGALAVALMDVAQEEGIKFRNVVSVGNKMQISETELLEFCEKDEKTKVVGMYLEGIKEGRKFIQVAEKISRKKPVIILKSGKTEKSQKTISSHTGALAGSDEIIEAVFSKTGIIRAENMGEFLVLIKMASVCPPPSNEKVVILTNAGGLGVLAADSFKNKQIELLEIKKETREKLREFLSEESSLENPIDLLGDAQEDRYQKALTVFSEEEAGTIVCLLTPQDQTPVDKIAQAIVDFKKNSTKNILAVFMGGEKIASGKMILEEAGVPVFFLVDRAVEATNKYSQWKKVKEKNQEEETFKNNEARKNQAEELIQKAKKENQKSLNYETASQIAGLYGIEAAESKTISATDNDFSFSQFPVVAKVDSDKVFHKTDQGGLVLNIQNQKELEKAIEDLRKKFPEGNIIIQPMLAKGTELILGIKNDEIFGPIVVYGLGGIYTEVFRMVDLLVPNLSLEEILENIKKSRIKFLFEKTRGQNPHNIEEVGLILKGLLDFSQECQNVKEVDINPLIIYNNDQKGVAVDIKIVI